MQSFRVNRPSFVLVLITIVLAAGARPAAATGSARTIVRTRSGLDGLSVIHSVCNLLGCQVVRSLDTLPGETAPSSLFLVQGPAVPVVTTALSLLGVEAVEPDLLARVATDGGWGSSQASAAVLDQLGDHSPVTYYGTSAWPAYFTQPAAETVGVRQTHCGLLATGGGTVAVIDTGVDPDHPALQAVLSPGYDFTRNAQGADEKLDVNQASAAVLDAVYAVNAGTAAVLDQASASVLDDSGHADFGHGTMVAGVVHLVAPTATIMPLKAFGADGQGYTSDIIRAIVFAGRNGAKVLNMSFSRSTPSNEIQRALNWANARGIIAVASAGNDGIQTVVYPAGYSTVLAVASVDDEDTRSSFSNYGPMVWVAAPGEGVITTYPWASFAAAWGTSFSTPFVAGAAALLVGLNPAATPDQAASATAQAVPLTPDLGHGQLDLYQAVQAGRDLWPDAPQSDVPESCSSMTDWTP